MAAAAAISSQRKWRAAKSGMAIESGENIGGVMAKISAYQRRNGGVMAAGISGENGNGGVWKIKAKMAYRVIGAKSAA